MAFQVVMSHASTFEPDSPLLQELSTLNSDFMEYFHRSGMLSKLELTPAFDFLHYVFQFMANEEAYHRMRACFPEFFAGLHSLKTLLERHITACSSSVNFLDNVSQIMGSKDIYHKTPQFDEFFAGLYFSTAGTPGCTRARGRSLSIGRF
ncbi:hypothetical protein BDZ97DRAFT_332472 [Flammula alnicola]|nr:hypothetical protein BDZ97DRAFT_332472 [Flammula alnicola]